MQERVVFDTNIYINLFNHGRHRDEFDGFGKVMYLAHPVLHELWIGARGNADVKHLTVFSRGFIRLGRLITPEPATQRSIGQVCQRLRQTAKSISSFAAWVSPINLSRTDNTVLLALPTSSRFPRSSLSFLTRRHRATEKKRTRLRPPHTPSNHSRHLVTSQITP